MGITIGNDDAQKVTIDGKEVYEVTMDGVPFYKDDVVQEDLDRIWDTIEKTFLTNVWHKEGTEIEVNHPDHIDMRTSRFYTDHVTWNQYLEIYHAYNKDQGDFWFHHVEGYIKNLENPQNYYLKMYIRTDTYYNLRIDSTIDINSNGFFTTKKRYEGYFIGEDVYNDGIALGTDETVHTPFTTLIQLIRKSDGKPIDYYESGKWSGGDLFAPEEEGLEKTQIIHGKVINDSINFSDYEVDYGVFTDAFYPKATVPVESDGSFHFWLLRERNNQGTVTFEVKHKTTGERIAIWHESQGLVKSYDVPIDFVGADGVPLYDILGNRCFIYDQAIALISALIYGDIPKAKFFAQGILDTQLDNDQWAFSYFTQSLTAPDPYFRNGATFWVVYSLLYYLDSGYIDSSTERVEIETAVKNALASLEADFWVEDETRMQHHTFTGGKGVYATDYSSFDAEHIVPWSSTEHNIDAYEAYILAAKLFNNDHYVYMRDSLEETLMETLWLPDEERACRGVRETLDKCHALDIGSWYSIAAKKAGETTKQNQALVSTDVYEVRLPAVDGTDIGFKPYSTLYCYPQATDTIWFEGTWGVILAYLAAGKKIDAQFYFQKAMLQEQNSGYPYTTIAQEQYEMQEWTSMASTAWAIIAATPKGFWNVHESLLN